MTIFFWREANTLPRSNGSRDGPTDDTHHVKRRSMRAMRRGAALGRAGCKLSHPAVCHPRISEGEVATGARTHARSALAIRNAHVCYIQPGISSNASKSLSGWAGLVVGGCCCPVAHTKGARSPQRRANRCASLLWCRRITRARRSAVSSTTLSIIILWLRQDSL